MHVPSEDHWAAIKCILCYLEAMTSYCLHIARESSLSLHGFTDTDWTGSVDDHKSTGCYLVYLGNTFVSWKYWK